MSEQYHFLVLLLLVLCQGMDKYLLTATWLGRLDLLW